MKLLTAKVITGSTVNVNKYYNNVDDYYEKEGAGIWYGKGAELLGLSGVVDKNLFVDALDGKHGDTVLRKKTFSKDKKERRAIDFTFSAPKSISIQALMVNDDNMIKAHEYAVKVAFDYIESYAAIRTKTKGMTRKENTNNLVGAIYRHELSREQEPQLHSHCVVINTSKHGDNWHALSNEMMLKQIKKAGTIYKKAMADYLLESGYKLRQTKDGYELDHISNQVIKALSTRSQQIEDRLQADGKNRDSAYGWEKQKETLKTRKAKKTVRRDELHQTWVEKTSAVLNIADLDAKKQISKTTEAVTQFKQLKPNGQAVGDFTEALKAVSFAIEHLEERQGLFTEIDIVTEAMKSGYVKNFDIPDVQKAVKFNIKNSTLLPEHRTFMYIKGVDRAVDDKYFKKDEHEAAKSHTAWIAHYMTEGFTPDKARAKLTQDIKNGLLVEAERRFASIKTLEREKQVLQTEKAHRGQVQPAMKKSEVERILAQSKLNGGQLQSAILALSSQNRFIGVHGLAGTGKSHTFSAIFNALKDNQSEFELFGVAPKGSQANSLKELGMDARTVALLLKSPKMQESITEKSILLLDEAGTLSTKDMNTLMNLVVERNARLIMVGDTKQTHAVEAGKPFELLIQDGMEYSSMDTIMRQKTEVGKRAVELASEGFSAAAIEELQASPLHNDITRINTQIIEVKKNDDRVREIVTAYIGYDAEKRDKTLILSGTNESRRDINKGIRTALNIENQINVKTLEPVDYSAPQRKQIVSYETGQVLVFNEHALNGIKKSERYQVEKVDTNTDRVFLRNLDTKEGVYFNVQKEGQKANLFEPVPTDFGTNDWIRITRNNNDIGLFNGERYKITNISADGHFYLVDGDNKEKILKSTEVNHFEHAYATTVYSAQGLTSEHVIFNADSKTLTSNKMTFYVAISRPQYGVKIFTDDREKMKTAMSRDAKKYNAVEIKTLDLYPSELAKAQDLSKRKQQSLNF